jgi:5-methylcytosine-specific restriction protein A
MPQTRDNLTMPTLPPPQCAAYGCKAPSVKGSRFCVDHAPAQSKPQTQRRALDDEYCTAAWQAIRAAQLSRAPLCACCTYEKRLTAAAVVDHVFPWKSYGPHAFRANLFQSLCIPCHSRKTNLENRGVYRHYLRPDHFRDYTPSDYPAALG